MKPKGAALWVRDVMVPLVLAAHPDWGGHELRQLWNTDEAYREYGHRMARADADTYIEVSSGEYLRSGWFLAGSTHQLHEVRTPCAGCLLASCLLCPNKSRCQEWTA
jgi:hypothetical protein